MENKDLWDQFLQAGSEVSDSDGTKPADEKQVMQEMTTAMQELTEELRYFRTQMGESAGSKTSAIPQNMAEKKKPNKILNIISNVLFYVVIVAMVLGAFLMRSTRKGQPFMLGGYSAANILTSSMENVYPKGTLIVTKQVDEKELAIGDDITFMVSKDISVTHRIIGITENYQNMGQRAFETKGTMNRNPDKEMVVASNVVGKVVFHSKVLGDIANFVKANWPLLIFILLVIIGLVTFLKWNAKRFQSDEEKKEDKPHDNKSKEHFKKSKKII